MANVQELELEQVCPYGRDEDADRELFLKVCAEKIPNFDRRLLNNAFTLCLMAHRNVYRSSGDAYYSHPMKVAFHIMNDIGYADNAIIAAAMLHDVVEDNPDYPLDFIEREFGKEIARIVNGVTKIKGINTRKLDKANTYTKLFEALVDDVRVMFIKLADRLDNMRTLTPLPKPKQQRIADETLNFYTPFAQRLGLIKIKRTLEILSFYFMDPEAYENIRKELAKKRLELLQYISKFYDPVSESLEKKDIPHVISIEHKHPYEIYKKSKEKNIPVSEIQDFYSMVVVLRTDDISECYKAYGVIANIFGPVSSLVDYIARPKINFYRALHSTHFGPDRRLVDVVIRTEEMDKIADTGVAAIYKIQSGEANVGKEDAHRFDEAEVTEWLKWMKDLIEDGDEDAIQKIWGSIRMNQYEKEINIMCKNRIYRLPNGACSVDLAFEVGEEVGLHCISAKINGEIKPLSQELRDNDTVEIITSPNSLPLEEWQNWVITHKALVKLYYYFREAKKAKELEKDANREPELKLYKFRVVGFDRMGLVKDISDAVGQYNIMRINISLNEDTIFEGAFTLAIPDNVNPNIVYMKILGVKGITEVEQLPDDDIML